MSIDQWQTRGANENAVKARRLVHEANTNIEYGEKTWTTRQTVRDLMQNHLDAETDVYYRAIAASVFDEGYLKAQDENGNGMRKKREELLHAAYLFARHAGDMSPVARAKSEAHLRDLSRGLPVKDEMKEHDEFSSSRFLEAVRAIPEARPAVSFEVRDSETGASLGWVPYETLESENMYRERPMSGFRYKIEGMKIVDRGAGFDSQLSSLYISSKTGKKHLRGKFGEGAKMSELHLLRNGATMKMRSSYNAVNGDKVERNRTWQARPMIVDGRLVSKGAEIQRDVAGPTGSMVSISLKDANDTFRKDFVENVDPRRGGLGKNIADFRGDSFVYPMPVSEKHLAGVDITGDASVQYVQGLRVELSAESFGYQKPCFSYDFLDSGIIAGRDRNQIKADITKRIPQLWYHADDPALIKALVRVAVHNDRGVLPRTHNHAVPEISALGEILYADKGILRQYEGNVSTTIDVERVQKLVDTALVEELGLEMDIPTLLTSSSEEKTEELQEILDYAQMRDYEVKRTAAYLGQHALQCFIRRLPKGYRVLTTEQLSRQMEDEEVSGELDVVEGEREKAIRKVFDDAAASLEEFARHLGLPPAIFHMTFATPDDPFERRSRRDDDERWRALRRRQRRSPVSVMDGWEKGEDYHVQIHADDVIDPRHGGKEALQRQLEIYLLNAYKQGDHHGADREQMLKVSQRFLNSHIPALIPKDSPLLSAIPDDMEYSKDPAVFERFWDVFLDKEEMELLKNEEHYGMYRKALRVDTSVDEFKEMQQAGATDMRSFLAALHSRVFVQDGTISYLSEKSPAWETRTLSDVPKVTEWNGFPVYKMRTNRFFLHMPMGEGAVLTRGEGKKREFAFVNDGSIMQIRENSVGFADHDPGGGDHISVQPDGLLITRKSDGARSGSHYDSEYIAQRLDGYRYYPTGEGIRGTKIVEGITSTSIPIEYGQDEWDNPVRVFEDIIQNHVDASENGQPVYLAYEIERGGARTWVNEAEIRSDDMITGLRVEDEGAGYYPNEIATMGATSKKSPLFAGKYGEGQKMVAAAVLRSGLELSYESQVRSEGAGRWRAQAVREARAVVLDGAEVEKQLVAFDVKRDESRAMSGSMTSIRLPDARTLGPDDLWSSWVSIIDPREKDERGYGGLSRYVRQLRTEGVERVHSMGSVKILFDEPGAVYENGIRINPQTESGRRLSFGYDVPEIVVTRERNSYDHDRLAHYMRHVISQTTEPAVIKEFLNKAVDDDSTWTTDIDIGYMLSGSANATPVWAQVAREIWPDRLVHSSEKMRRDAAGDPNAYEEDAEDRMRHLEERMDATKKLANMTHIDKDRLLDVNPVLYKGLSMLLPTSENFLKKITGEVLPAPPAIRAVLSRLVAESVQTFSEMFSGVEGRMTPEQLRMYPLSAEHVHAALERWGNAKAIEERDAVAIAPFGTPYHGKAEEKGVVFNEALLFPDSKRKLAHVGLHESAHLVSQQPDYTEDFVETLYELCRHLAKKSRS